MIPRYTRAEMEKIWSDEFKYSTWLKIEILACEQMFELGLISDKDLKTIKEKASFNIEEIQKIEAETKHDVIAFLTSVANSVGAASRHIHLGMTSSDVLDTSFAYQLKKAGELILLDLKELGEALKAKARKYKNTPVMGRTHGIHAEPSSFGLKFLVFYNEMQRNIRRLKVAIEDIAVGKLSGPVGNYSSIDPSVEVYVCKKMGLKPETAATQVVQRDRHAAFFSTLAVIAGTLEKIAIEIRHLQRTEVSEVNEGFSKGQKGSSAMPHKKNPIGSENITGLSRVLRSNAIAALENVALWHERDISHSSVERIIAPDSTIIADYAITRMAEIIRNLVVYPENMSKNIEQSYGLCFSGRVLLAVINKTGLTREAAYKIVQRCSLRALDEKRHLKYLLQEDEELSKKLKKMDLKKLIEEAFNLKHYFSHIPYIYNRSLK